MFPAINLGMNYAEKLRELELTNPVIGRLAQFSRERSETFTDPSKDGGDEYFYTDYEPWNRDVAYTINGYRPDEYPED